MDQAFILGIREEADFKFIPVVNNDDIRNDKLKDKIDKLKTECARIVREEKAKNREAKKRRREKDAQKIYHSVLNHKIRV